MSTIDPASLDAHDLRKAARAAYKAGEFSEAAELSEHLLGREAAGDPATAAADRADYGAALLRLDRQAEAAEAYAKSLELQPAAPSVRSRYARILSRMERPQEAAEQYRKLLEDEPDNADYMVALASELRWLDQIDEARDLLNRALEINPSNIEAKLVMLAIGRNTQMKSSPTPVSPGAVTPGGAGSGGGAGGKAAATATKVALPRLPGRRPVDDDDGMGMADDGDEEEQEDRPMSRRARKALPFWFLASVAFGLACLFIFLRSLFP